VWDLTIFELESNSQFLPVFSLGWSDTLLMKFQVEFLPALEKVFGQKFSFDDLPKSFYFAIGLRKPVG
jgi:hypothetical protein